MEPEIISINDFESKIRLANSELPLTDNSIKSIEFLSYHQWGVEVKVTTLNNYIQIYYVKN